MAAVIGVFAGLGLAVAWLAQLLWPPGADLATSVARFDLTRRAPASPVVGGWVTVGETRLGRWLIPQLEARRLGAGLQWADLEVLDRSPERWAGRKALVAVIGALLPPAAAAVFAAAGSRLPMLPPLLACPVVGAAFWFLPDVDLRRAAAARRRDFTRALGSYLDLVAMSLAGGRAVPEALPTAAAVGNGWAFGLLEETVARARLVGHTPWQALGELGDRIGVVELSDLATALTLVAHDGARVRESISARAASLRRRQLTEAAGKAGQADQGMLVAQVVLAFAFLLLIIYPAAYQVLTF